MPESVSCFIWIYEIAAIFWEIRPFFVTEQRTKMTSYHGTARQAGGKTTGAKHAFKGPFYMSYFILG